MTTSSLQLPARSGTGIRVFVMLASVATILTLTLAPRALVGPARGLFMRFAHLVANPVVEPMTYAQVESTLNALMFVPLGAALAILLSRRLWVLAPMIGFVLSIAVETLQSRIPGRVPDLGDVVWNSLGALAGAIVAGVLRLVALGLRRLRTRAVVTRGTDAARVTRR